LGVILVNKASKARIDKMRVSALECGAQRRFGLVARSDAYSISRPSRPAKSKEALRAALQGAYAREALGRSLHAGEGLTGLRVRQCTFRPNAVSGGFFGLSVLYSLE
jgi:hypothetical protein